MADNLLIVESPAKSKTITKYLEGHRGQTWKVLASYGHCRDLEHGNHAVDVKNDFEMHYKIDDFHKDKVDDIVREAKKATAIYLASDLDREGEAIAWHVSELLKERGAFAGKAVHRISFAEITKKAIEAAIASPRALDMNMVNAQQARRALDYLVGYNLSPVLWKKVHKGLSAGRVQSPALRLIAQREDEIDAFDPKEHWSITGDLSKDMAFKAKLYRYRGEKVEQFTFIDEKAANAAKDHLIAQAKGIVKVSSVTKKERRRRPYAPFTTSTLQQDAGNRLGFNVTKIMQIAQGLYEGVELGEGRVGLITYMRTDSVNLSADALFPIRDYIKEKYGSSYLPEKPNYYSAKTKNAQEAHEAIRPSDVRRTPEKMAKYLDRDQLKLYELIWKRTVACQMEAAVLDTTAVEFDVGSEAALSSFRASGSVVKFPGFLALYDVGKDVDGKDEENARMPAFEEGDVAKLVDVTAEQHFTEPPPRFNEASLVKRMEEMGIGRPSTYESIIKVLQVREYVELRQRRFHPTDMGRIVAGFLSKHFDTYVDYDFTSNLEDLLDDVSRGEKDWKPLLHEFFAPFDTRVKDVTQNVERDDAMGARQLGTDPASGRPVSARISKNGPVIQIGLKTDEEKPRWASLPEGMHLQTITLEEALKLFVLPLTLGKDVDGSDLVANRGLYGPYVKSARGTASIPKEIDVFAITLEQALAIIQERVDYIAKRDIQVFKSGIMVQNGKYGVMIREGKIIAAFPDDKDPKTITEAECKAILAENGKEVGKGRFKKKKKGGKGKPEKPSKGKGGGSKGGSSLEGDLPL